MTRTARTFSTGPGTRGGSSRPKACRRRALTSPRGRPQRFSISFARFTAVRRVDLRQLRRILRMLLDELLHIPHAELGVCLVGAPEIARLNETFLRHAGATDVIAFDYSDSSAGRVASPPALHGEIFICMDEAVRQAGRYRTTWPEELTRYLVHGVLHLLGYDDRRSAARLQMKAAEDRLLGDLKRRFNLLRLSSGARTVQAAERR